MRKSLILIFLIITIVFTPFFISPDLLTHKDNDLGRTYIPIANFIRKSVYHGHQIPLWRPDQFMGETFIGNPLSSLFYPANILFIIFEPETASIIYLYLHILIASIATFYLAKSFSVKDEAALVAAVFYGLSTKILVHVEAGHITLVAALALFPLSLYLLRKFQKTLNSKWLYLCALVLALTYFAHPAIFFYSFIFITAYWLYKIFPSRKVSRNELVKSLAAFILLAVLTASTMAIALIPHLEFAQASTRSQLTLEDVAQPLWSLKKLSSSLLFPYLQKDLDHEAYLYLGLAPMVLALLGFLALSAVKKTVLFSGLLITLLYISGTSTPFFPLLYKYLPIISSLRVTTRPWFIVALIAAILSAIAINRLKNQKVYLVALAIFLLEISLIFSQRLSSVPNLSFTNEPLYQFLGEDKDVFRVYCTTYCFNPQLLSKYSLQLLAGESPVQLKGTVDFLKKAGNYDFSGFTVIFPPYQAWQSQSPPIPNIKLLGQANVKYIASTYEIPDKDLIFIKKFENILLYKNNLYKPRFSFEDSTEPLKIAHISPDAINLKFEKQKITKTILISENFYPGWEASIINQKFSVTKNEPVGMKVVIPADTSDIWLKFQPKSLIIARTITLASLVFMLLFALKKKKISL